MPIYFRKAPISGIFHIFQSPNNLHTKEDTDNEY
jgi:hypothetical protein